MFYYTSFDDKAVYGDGSSAVVAIYGERVSEKSQTRVIWIDYLENNQRHVSRYFFAIENGLLSYKKLDYKRIDKVLNEFKKETLSMFHIMTTQYNLKIPKDVTNFTSYRDLDLGSNELELSLNEIDEPIRNALDLLKLPKEMPFILSEKLSVRGLFFMGSSVLLGLGAVMLTQLMNQEDRKENSINP